MIIEYDHACDIPQDWDSCTGDNPYMKRSFLTFIESIDQCSQKYCMVRECDGSIKAIFMTYIRYNFNLLMFTPVKGSFQTTFIYVPLSVTRPGIILLGNARIEITEYLRKIKGLKLCLNIPEKLELPGFTKAKTFPRCVLQLKWNSFDEYINALRSNYRHRYNKARSLGQKMSFRILSDNSHFDNHLYSLYEQVYDNSPYKIEKLKKPFFNNPMFKIGVFEIDGVNLGFIQLVENYPELIFEFIGFDKNLNHKYDIYINLLLEIVRYGINNEFKWIDFGQTADEAKLKLGARYMPLYALLHHSNPFINFLLRHFINLIQYKPLDQDRFHVFKNFSG